MITLGKLEKIDNLRSVWPNEPKNFTKWLAEEENLELLSEALGIELALGATESPVGDFSVDLYATEEETGRRVIIENQLEDTNHDHLGKILTYAAGKDASIVVWIVKRARDEHKKAIEWLNSHTDKNISFFLLEIEIWKIGNSLPAPKFNIVEMPNEWAKELKSSENITEIKLIQLQFWESFINYASENLEFINAFSLQKARPQQWYNLSVGSSKFHIALSINTQKKILKAGLYIRGDKTIFEKFSEQWQKFQSLMDVDMMQWKEAKKDCRIYTSLDADILGNKQDWPAYFQWLCDISLRLRKVINKIDI